MKKIADLSAPLACLLALAAGLSSCRSPQQPELLATPAPVIPDAFWIGDGVPGSPRIVINLSDQRLRYYKGGELVGVTPIATGTRSHPTPTGSFRITQKNLNHRSSHYGDYVSADGRVVRGDIDARKDARPPGTSYRGASMRYFMRVRGAIGMHEGYLPGYPASHGCIRMPTQMAAILFRETPLGTPVQVVGNAAAAGPQPVLPVGYGIVQGVAPPVQPTATAQAVPSTAPSSASVPREEVRRAKPAKPPKWAKTKPQSAPRGQTLYLE